MFGYYVSHIWHTAVTQFDHIIIKYSVISVMFRKCFAISFLKVFPTFCFDMATVWWVKPYNFSCAYTFNRTLFMMPNFFTENTLFESFVIISSRFLKFMFVTIYFWDTFAIVLWISLTIFFEWFERTSMYNGSCFGFSKRITFSIFQVKGTSKKCAICEFVSMVIFTALKYFTYFLFNFLSLRICHVLKTT